MVINIIFAKDECVEIYAIDKTIREKLVDIGNDYEALYRVVKFYGNLVAHIKSELIVSVHETLTQSGWSLIIIDLINNGTLFGDFIIKL